MLHLLIAVTIAVSPNFGLSLLPVSGPIVVKERQPIPPAEPLLPFRRQPVPPAQPLQPPAGTTTDLKTRQPRGPGGFLTETVPASTGTGTDTGIADQAPIVDLQAPTLGPTLNFEPVPGLPSVLQPDPGDILLARAFWPWEDLGAKSIPEHWLYMSRHVQGVIAQLAVQTPGGPKLLKALADGSMGVTVTSGLTDVIDRALRQLGVVSGSMTILPTEFTNGQMSSTAFDFALAAGATLAIAGGIPGHSTSLICISYAVVTVGAAEVTVENVDGTTIWAKIRTDAIHSGTLWFYGAAATAGVAQQIRWHNTSGVAAGTLAGNILAINV